MLGVRAPCGKILTQRLAPAQAMLLFLGRDGVPQSTTFKRDLQAFAKGIPQDRLLVETDSPFLAPVPHRGRTCEPGFVRDTAKFLADLRSENFEDLAEYTTRNFYTLFSKAAA